MWHVGGTSDGMPASTDDAVGSHICSIRAGSADSYGRVR
jgi:hypothetical protein